MKGKILKTVLITALVIAGFPFCVSGQWTTRAPSPNPRWGAAACQLGGIIYLFGGNNGSDLGTSEKYDPSTNTWSTNGVQFVSYDAPSGTVTCQSAHLS